MNERFNDDRPGERDGPSRDREGSENEAGQSFHPGNPGFPEHQHERRLEWSGRHTPGQYERGPQYQRSPYQRDAHFERGAPERGHEPGSQPERMGHGSPSFSPGEQRPWNRSGARFEDRRGHDEGGWSQPLNQRAFGHSPFSRSALTESDPPAYFGTGSQGVGGGPGFTGGRYGHADERLDSPYFQEVGFNRGYYGDVPDQYGEGGGAELRRKQALRRRYPPGPKGYQRSDERLREDISERLMHSYDIDSSEVTVEVLGGKVILEGTVPNRYMKHGIEDLADAAPGVQDIDNRIRVVGAGGAASRAPEVHGG
ncbi:MAG TPA: BON domain-containing protein [Steroidobacteraceae bacterium]|nr:BON domain-containing protein [Steroidobacteraceae bacterium]